jgi:hypothetical protein
LHSIEWNKRLIAVDEKKVVGKAGIFMHSHPPSRLGREEGCLMLDYFILVALVLR